jgi:hypothetical protein
VTEKLTKSDGGDSGAGRRRRAIRVVGGCGRDAQDDSVAVLDLERQRFSRRAVSSGYLEGAPVERVTRIDDGDSGGVILTVNAARGIKKVPRSSCAGR